MRLTRRAGAAVGALALAGVLGGGVAYAATQVTDPPGTRASASTTAMMTGGGMGMGRFTQAAPFDAQFLDQMIVHHEGAVASTQVMIADSLRPKLRALARDIITSQRAQLHQMRTWRARWYPHLAPTFAMGNAIMSGPMTGTPSPREGMMGGSRMSGSMMGRSMMGGSMMGKSGTDRMYLQMMIAHHQLGVDMAEQAQKRGSHPQLRDMAATIATEQAVQITQMRGYLTAMPDSGPD